MTELGLNPLGLKQVRGLIMVVGLIRIKPRETANVG